MSTPSDPKEITDEQVAAFEIHQLSAYYRAAPPALRSLAWNILQTPPTAENRPVLLAFVLAMDILENEEARRYHAEQKDGESIPTQEEVIACFWQGMIGMCEGRELLDQTTESEAKAITSAARGLVSLCPERVAASKASKTPGAILTTPPTQKVTRERETDPTEEHLSRV